MKTSLLTIVLFIGGCTSYSDGWEVTKAYESCKENNGVDYLSYFSRYIRCTNGKIFKLDGE
jgi:hypothetical protein